MICDRRLLFTYNIVARRRKCLAIDLSNEYIFAYVHRVLRSAEVLIETFRSENQDQDQDQFWPRAHWHHKLALELVRVKLATFRL